MGFVVEGVGGEGAKGIDMDALISSATCFQKEKPTKRTRSKRDKPKSPSVEEVLPSSEGGAKVPEVTKAIDGEVSDFVNERLSSQDQASCVDYAEVFLKNYVAEETASVMIDARIWKTFQLMGFFSSSSSAASIVNNVLFDHLSRFSSEIGELFRQSETADYIRHLGKSE